MNEWKYFMCVCVCVSMCVDSIRYAMSSSTIYELDYYIFTLVFLLLSHVAECVPARKTVSLITTIYQHNSALIWLGSRTQQVVITCSLPIMNDRWRQKSACWIHAVPHEFNGAHSSFVYKFEQMRLCDTSTIPNEAEWWSIQKKRQSHYHQ